MENKMISQLFLMRSGLGFERFPLADISEEQRPGSEGAWEGAWLPAMEGGSGHQRQASVPTDRNVVINSSNIDINTSIDEHFKQSLYEKAAASRGRSSSNLPSSFHNPRQRSSGSIYHSRDNSDSSSGRGTLSPGVVPPARGALHKHTNSSPAILHNSSLALHQAAAGPGHPVLMGGGGLAVAPPAAALHAQSKSCEADGLLGPGSARHLYPPSHTPWSGDKSASVGSLDGSRIGELDASALGPLPPGWEMQLTPTGDKYFIDHTKRLTTWYDPRIPEDVQKDEVLARHGMTASQPTQPSRAVQELNAEQQALRLRSQQVLQGMNPDPYMGGQGTGAGSMESGIGGMAYTSRFNVEPEGMDLDPNIAYDATTINPDELNQYLNLHDSIPHPHQQ